MTAYRRGMRLRALAGPLLVSLAAGGTSSNASSPGPLGGDAGDAGAPSGARDVLLARMVAERGLVGCTAAVRRGAFAWSGAAGVADLTTGAPLSPDTPLRIASITKAMTATVVMSLVDEGRVALDATVSTYLPDVRGADRYTVRQLLGHRTGLVPYQETEAFARQGGFGDPSKVWSPRALVALVEDLPLAFEPGTNLAYSNTNFVLAGMIAEKQAGVPVEQALRERVYGKAGMKDAWLDGAEAVARPLARGYSVRFDARGNVLASPGPKTDTTTALNPSVAWTTGAVVSTAPDVARFFEALLAGRLVSSASTTAMTTSPAAPGVTPAYGLGLWRYGNASTAGWGHTGDTAGYRSFGAGTAAGETVAAVVCNDDADAEAPRAIAEALAAEP